MTKRHVFTIAVAAAMLCGFARQLEAKIIVSKDADYVVPVAITGFSGEASSILKFDLYVLGFNIVDPSQAEFEVSGSGNGRVEGRLTVLATKENLFARAYNGGSTRSQAHALADDVVKQIRPELPPIFHGKVAYRVRQGGNAEVGVADFDGHNATIVTHDNSLVAYPAWLPGKFAVLYCSWKNSGTQIFEHDLSTGSRRIFIHSPGSSYSPAVSPDGKKVAMVLDRNGTPNLYAADIDGGNLKQLTFGKDDVSGPSWAPNNQDIVFATRSGRASLTKVNINGGGPQKLRVGGAEVYGNLTQPNWSPDGKWIVFTCGSGPFSICVAPSSGGEAKALVSGEDPCWAPNSRTVIFTRDINHKHVLSLLDVPTKHVKDCTQNSGECSQPAWAR
ncbi:MAG: Translocation protein TolB [Verrucomicrobiales bacterium]|nr:Translocation protein TolB [Verrucomicrobiales bacterium]